MSKIQFEELEAALRIDENALEEALRIQPDVYYRVGRAMALSMSQRDEAKKELEETEAAIDLEHRRNAAAVERKVTEGELKSMLMVNRNVKQARETMLVHDRRLGKLRALKDAFEQRSWALNKLVDLYIHNYYGASSQHAAADTAKNMKSRQYREELKKERT